MREITHHQVDENSSKVKIKVIDKPGAGGANHEYLISCDEATPYLSLKINFQNGPIGERGINGVTQEMLLAVVIDRLESFQAGEFACRENELALKNARESLNYLNKRTKDRVKRRVEGTNQK